MDFELPEELAEVQKLAHDFAEKEIAPTAAKDDRQHVFRKDLVTKMGDLGFFGCLVPEDDGGNGLGFLAHALISEEIARIHSAIRVYLNMQAGPAGTIAWVETIGVDPAYRGRGIARELIEEFISSAEDHGIKTIFTLVSIGQTDMQSFFNRQGFAQGKMLHYQKELAS